MKFKVMTLNIHKGFSMFNQRSILSELKEAIQGHKVDILCLQEVLGEHSIHAKRPQFEQLADQIWKHCAYGRNSVYSSGHHGNAMLSHFPFVEFENFDITNHRFERRGVLHGVVTAPEWKGKRLHIMTVHLDLFSMGRKRQLRKLVDLVRARVIPGEPLVLAGDFNDWSLEANDLLFDELGLKEVHFERFGEYAKTYPSQYPVLRLDRIYCVGLEVGEVLCLAGAPWSNLSDHLGLVSTLSF